MTNKQYVDGLRQMADFYEQNPSLNLPYEEGLTVYGNNTKEEALAVAATLGKCRKVFEGTSFFLVKDFGELELRFYFARDRICERVVVGTKVIPPVSYPERFEEVVEWKCHPLLKE